MHYDTVENLYLKAGVKMLVKVLIIMLQLYIFYTSCSTLYGTLWNSPWVLFKSKHLAYFAKSSDC